MLSYVLTTRNKLKSLRLLLDELVADRRADEEIVAVDAGSSDGTQEYLRELAAAGAISTWVSEPDKGESHGYNKALLLSRGAIVKPITDDDVFDWSVVRACARFMAEHPEVDALGGNIGRVSTTDEGPLAFAAGNEDTYLRYWRGECPRASFNGIPLMLRRSSLPLLGLFHVGCHAVDHEYTLRITGLATVAWCTAMVGVHIENAGSKLQTGSPTRALVAEKQRLDDFYDWHPDPPPKQPGIVARLRGRRPAGQWYQVDPAELPVHVPPLPERVPFETRYAEARAWLAAENATRVIEFLVPPGKRHRLAPTAGTESVKDPIAG